MDAIACRSVLACPDCGGVMWEIDEDQGIRHRCHVGHAYTAELMSVALDENGRSATAMSLRALEDRIPAAHSLHKQSSSQGCPSSAQSWAAKIGELEHQVDVVRGAMWRIDEIAFHSTQE